MKNPVQMTAIEPSSVLTYKQAGGRLVGFAALLVCSQCADCAKADDLCPKHTLALDGHSWTNPDVIAKAKTFFRAVEEALNRRPVGGSQ